MGHGARGLQRRTATPGTIFPHDHARSRAYRWGEDGIAGFSDDQQRWCLGARAVERARPDPQGAAVRPDQRGGQSRRGRQGALLLPRRHADAIPTCGCSTNIRRRAFPYARAGRRRTARRGTRRARIRADRHRRLRRATAISTSRSNTPRPTPDDILMRVTVTNRGPDAAALHLLPQLWARNTWSWSRARRRAAAARDARRHRCARRASDAAADAASTSTARPSCCSARTRPTRRACSARDGAGLVQGRHQRLSSSAATAPRSTAATGTKCAAHLRARHPGRRAP